MATNSAATSLRLRRRRSTNLLAMATLPVPEILLPSHDVWPGFYIST